MSRRKKDNDLIPLDCDNCGRFIAVRWDYLKNITTEPILCPRCSNGKTLYKVFMTGYEEVNPQKAYEHKELWEKRAKKHTGNDELYKIYIGDKKNEWIKETN